MVKVEIDTRGVRQALSDLEHKQMPFAIALAATRIAQRVKKSTLTIMAKRLDRPTPTTMSSLFVKSATKSKPVAETYFKDKWGSGIPADRYLQQAVLGGVRRHKRVEEALIARGIMRRSQYAIPADAFLDRYGNASRGLIMRVLSGLGAAETVSGYQANATNSRRSRRKGNAQRYFAGVVDGTHGVWERKSTAWGTAVRPVFLFSDGAPGYRVIFPFFTIAENIVRANYRDEFEEALAHAIRTAR